MRSIRKSVQSKVRQPIARQMFGLRPARGEHQPLWNHPMRRRSASQVLDRPPVGVEQPQHAVRHRLHDSHPPFKHIRKYFVTQIKATKYHPLSRQPTLISAWPAGADFPPAVIDLVAIRKTDYLLAVEALQCGRNDSGISNNVVDAIGSHRSGITQPIDLDRSRP